MSYERSSVITNRKLLTLGIERTEIDTSVMTWTRFVDVVAAPASIQLEIGYRSRDGMGSKRADLTATEATHIAELLLAAAQRLSSETAPAAEADPAAGQPRQGNPTPPGTAETPSDDGGHRDA